MTQLFTNPNLWYQNHLTVIEAVLVFSLLAMSVQVCMRAGVFSLASVGFWAIGGYISANLVKNHHLDHPIAIAIAIAVAVGIGFLFSLPLLRLRGLYLGLATIAFDLVVVVFALNGGSFTGGPLGLYAIPVRVSVPQLVFVVAVIGYLLTRLETGRTGRYFDALRNDEPLAAALGIRVNRWRVFAFTLSAAIAALSGSMHVLLFNAISPEQFGFSLIILVLSMVVVGGAASWVGALLGATLIEFLPEFLSNFDKWKDVAYGVLLILVVGYAPDGILGLIQQGLRRLRGRGAKPSITAIPAGASSVAVGPEAGGGPVARQGALP